MSDYDNPVGLTAIPAFELDPSGGQVVVTRFECSSLWTLGALLLLHQRVKHAVSKQAEGFLGAKTLVQWRRRTMLSITLWENIQSVYTMGNVMQHVRASKVPHRIGVATNCGVYCFAGDWRRVMFHVEGVQSHSPLAKSTSVFDRLTTECNSRLHAYLRGGSHAHPD
jgi:hypothetical protein